MSQQSPPPPSSPPSPPAAEAPASLPPAPPPWWAQPPRRRSAVGRIFRWLGLGIFIVSILLNVYLLMLVGARMERVFDRAIVRPGKAGEVVAVYTIDGLIDSTQAARFGAFCREVTDDDDVRAVVLRVVSPGGGVGPSDQMHALVEKLKDEGKKVVVSMGDVAASGGYYISAPADEIIAEPTTMTGSIGVMANWVVFRGTLEKIGAESMVLRSSHTRGWKDSISLTRKPHDRQRKHLQEILDEMQDRFEDLVRKGRGGKLPRAVLERRMDPVEGKVTVNQAGKEEEVQSEPPDPFNGKVYLARRAKALGLVDDIGYEEKAVERAAALAKLGNPKVVRYARRRGVLERMLGGAQAPTMGVQVDRRLLDDLQTPRIMMLWKAE